MKFNKVYILCPGGVKTGGTELLHQLVFQINQLDPSGSNASIVYVNYKDFPVVTAFKKYTNGQWLKVSDIIDDEDNLVIFPETLLNYFNEFKYIKKYIWWLSVDNYLYNNFFSKSLQKFGLLSSLHSYLKGNIKDKSKYIYMADKHLCQSYYAINYLKRQSISSQKIVYLSDYINDIYIKNSNKSMKALKKNIVLYNPKKGKEFTEKIIRSSPKKIKYVPLINMTNEEVLQNLRQSKVYIDFGSHPGKDRFPREAAISGCCILTGKRGAAKYYQDIPIESKFKCDENNVSKIVKKIEYLINNYDDAINEFYDYRVFIMNEKKTFIKSCKDIFL